MKTLLTIILIAFVASAWGQTKEKIKKYTIGSGVQKVVCPLITPIFIADTDIEVNHVLGDYRPEKMPSSTGAYTFSVQTITPLKPVISIENPDDHNGAYVLHLNKKDFIWVNDSTAVYKPVKR